MTALQWSIFSRDHHSQNGYKGPFECIVLLEQSYNGSLPSNEKHTMNMHTNEIFSNSNE